MARVDAEGHILALAVVPAKVLDRDTLTARDDGRAVWPSLRLAILNGAFTCERRRAWCRIHSMRHNVVEGRHDQRGFVVLEQREVIVRFGWLSHWAGRSASAPATPRRGDRGRLACAVGLMAVTAPYNSAWDC